MRDNGRIQRILIIDDSDEDRARIRAALMQGNPERRYLFKEAANGEEGLRLCEQLNDWPIDCVIIDIHMPRMSGPDFLKILRQPRDFPVLPVVVLTGSAENQDAGATLQLGAQDYITKDSIYPSVLFRVVDNAVERHQLLRELHESRNAADAANRAKSAMVGNISHELRTPMTAVMGLCDVLLDSELTDDQRRLLGMVRDNGEYLVEIVNDLLDLSKMEAGSLELDSELFSPGELLSRAVDLMKVRADENETQLELEMDRNVPEIIQGDPVRVRQLVLNLLSNAVKFSPQGSVTVRVGVRDEGSPEEQLRIDVVDTGVGISQDSLEKIFLPFVQAENQGRSRLVGGTGLGLAICRRLVDMMGGRLTVESQVDVGSTFACEFPFARTAVNHLPSEDKLIRLSSPVEELLDGCEILVAEDTRATRVLLERFLTVVNAKPTMVQDGEELVATYRKGGHCFKAIVTDIQMPGMNGLEATSVLREHGCTLPILVLTADAVNETREEATRAGATDILTKPIDRKLLLEKLAQYCDEKDCDD